MKPTVDGKRTDGLDIFLLFFRQMIIIQLVLVLRLVLLVLVVFCFVIDSVVCLLDMKFFDCELEYTKGSDKQVQQQHRTQRVFS